MAKEAHSKKRKGNCSSFELWVYPQHANEGKTTASIPEGEVEKMKKVKQAEKVTTEVAAKPIKKRKGTEYSL